MPNDGLLGYPGPKVSDELNVLRTRYTLNGVSTTPPAVVFDGDKPTGGANYWNMGSGSQVLVIDMLRPVDIAYLALLTYTDGRVYNGIAWDVSRDGTVWRNVRQAAAGSCANGSSPILTQVNQRVRYLRLSMAGSVANSNNEIMEIEAFGRLPTT
jgi:hypothetical protein